MLCVFGVYFNVSLYIDCFHSKSIGGIVFLGLITSDRLSFLCVYCYVKALMYSIGTAGVNHQETVSKPN